MKKIGVLSTMLVAGCFLLSTNRRKQIGRRYGIGGRERIMGERQYRTRNGITRLAQSTTC